jgi:hypothetical protein
MGQPWLITGARQGDRHMHKSCGHQFRVGETESAKEERGGAGFASRTKRGAGL